MDRRRSEIGVLVVLWLMLYALVATFGSNGSVVLDLAAWTGVIGVSGATVYVVVCRRGD